MSEALRIGAVASFVFILAIRVCPGQGATIFDDFDDNSIDSNLWDLVEAGGFSLDEANQRVECTSLEVLPEQEGQLVLKVAQPYEETWDVTLDVHVDDYGLAQDPNTYEYGLALKVVNTLDPTDRLLIGRTRGYDGHPGAIENAWGVNKNTDDGGQIDEFTEAGLGLSDGTMKIVWDGAVFDLYYDEGAGFQPLETGISVADWGMDAGSTFTILVVGFDTAVLGPLDDPEKVYFDNFALSSPAQLDLDFVTINAGATYVNNLPCAPALYSVDVTLVGTGITDACVTLPAGGICRPLVFFPVRGTWDMEPDLQCSLTAPSVGTYTLTFNGGAEQVALPFDVTPTTCFANVTMPAPGATGVSPQPTFVWDSVQGCGASLQAEITSESLDEDVAQADLPIGATEWPSPVELLPESSYSFQIEVFEESESTEITSGGDSLRYVQHFEHENTVFFSLCGQENECPPPCLHPNQITGTIEFSNENPEILAILNAASDTPSGLDEGFNTLLLTARSIDVQPPLESFLIAEADGRTSTRYEITVESGTCGAGTAYSVTVDMRLASDRPSSPANFHTKQYLFAEAISGEVHEEPAAGVPLAVSECATLLHVTWTDSQGNPVEVTGGSILAYRETEPGSGVFDFRSQACSRFFPAGTTEQFLPVRGDGTLYRVDITSESGDDFFSNKIRTLEERTLRMECDEIVDIVVEVPSGSEVGSITGAIDMLGEKEHQLVDYTRATTFGPFDNARLDRIVGIPSSGPFELENLIPSGATSPATPYRVRAEMYFRQGRSFEFFRSPFLDALVEADANTDLGDSLVMEPGFFSGDILFVGPGRSEDSPASCLEALFRISDEDEDGDGIPDSELHSLGSYVISSGTSVPAPGATHSTRNGFGQAVFAGEFIRETNSFLGAYELVLGSLLKEPGLWTRPRFRLRFLDTSTPARTSSYQDSSLFIGDTNSQTVELGPGTTTRIPHHYCFSEVRLSIRTSQGAFFAPAVKGTGTFLGEDFEGNLADYGVILAGVVLNEPGAKGTPVEQADATDEGLVVMCLPQGDYTLRPLVNFINPDGSISEIELLPITFPVGCRQVINVATDLVIAVDAFPECTTERTVTVSGSVFSQAPVTTISFALNDDPEVAVCTDCGSDPEFSFEVSLENCDNGIVITARNDFGTASVSDTIQLVLDNTPPEISCPGRQVIEADPATNTADVSQLQLPTGATDSCDGTVAVLCDAPRTLPLGVTTVTCRTVDSCGNQSQCEFEVEVIPGGDPLPDFVRCDANGDGSHDISDVIWVINELFRQGPPSSCQHASDCNDDGRINASDTIYSLQYSFQGGPQPEPPFPDCGADGTVDGELDCEVYEHCEPGG